METKQKISYTEFTSIQEKLDIRTGVITQVQRVPKSSKLLNMDVDLGVLGKKTCVTNIGQYFDDPDVLLGRVELFLVNLEPVKMMGITSEVMIVIPTSEDGTPTLLRTPGNIVI